MADSTYLVTNKPLDSDLFTEGFKNDITPLDDHNLNTLIDGITYVDANSTAKDTKLKQDLDALLATKADKTYVDENKVAKEAGKQLSTNDFTNADKSKLDSIAANAEVNVQADWDEQDTDADSYIKNKPAIPDISNLESKFDILEINGCGVPTSNYANWTGEFVGFTFKED
jgi:hypothetical protein